LAKTNTMNANRTIEPIPVKANLIAGIGACIVSAFCLWLASHAQSWWVMALAAIVFSFTNNTLFSLHHEAVHGHLHSNISVNDWCGRLLAATFPTIFSIQRVSHLGHHRRNRSDEELYDSYLPHQSWLLKTYWLYCLLTGFYWSIIPVAGLVYVLWPWTFRATWFQDGPAKWWGFKPFVEDIARQPVAVVWREGVFTLLVQVSLFWLLDLNVLGWLLCYWAFGINWSSVQYTDHADSPRHVTEGAWNLRFTRLSQILFLNYNLHLVHHRQPTIPWLYLPRHVKPEDPNPSFWKIYLRLWLGAKPATEHLTEKVS
jgi:fatty acid desaturase